MSSNKVARMPKAAELVDKVEICLFEVEELLDTYTVEEVQSALNNLVHDSDWLSDHRKWHSTLKDLTGPYGRYDI